MPKIVSRETFEDAPVKTKLNFLFDIQCCNSNKIDVIDKCLRRNKIIDKVYLGICGFLGGLATWFFK